MCSNSTGNVVTAGADNQFNPKTKLIGVKRAKTEYCNSNKNNSNNNNGCTYGI